MRLREFISYWFPALLYMALIFYLSSLPNASFEGVSSFTGFNDKSEHFIEYFVLGILLFRLFNYYNSKYAPFKAAAFSTLYGLLDEIHQYFVPTRVFSFNDIFYDLLGSLASVAVVLAFYARKKQALVKAERRINV